MIVKNEENNIERALQCLKDVVFEQIVVDTGSSDKTVEIATKMGAKVYSFDWIGDFSAAKNHAIDKATGDWILFGDADEYYLPEDASRIQGYINKIEVNPEASVSTLAISLMCVNLDDGGKPMTKAGIVRIFRNAPTVRYQGRIHEQLTISAETIAHADEIEFMHTGYSETVHNKKGKAERNIELLRQELIDNPGNLNLKAYLADSLSTLDDNKSQKEAEALFGEVINSKAGERVNSVLRVKAFTFFINKYMKTPESLNDCEKVCRKALAAYPRALDFGYYLAKVLSMKGEHAKAWEQLKVCEQILVSENGREDISESSHLDQSLRVGQSDSGTDASIMINADPTTLFCQMIITAQGMGDFENMVLYSLHVLSMDKSRTSILGPCIANLVYHGISDTEIIELLSNVYDFSNKGDISIVVEAAKNCGAKQFADKVLKAM